MNSSPSKYGEAEVAARIGCSVSLAAVCAVIYVAHIFNPDATEQKPVKASPATAMVTIHNRPQGQFVTVSDNEDDAEPRPIHRGPGYFFVPLWVTYEADEPATAMTIADETRAQFAKAYPGITVTEWYTIERPGTSSLLLGIVIKTDHSITPQNQSVDLERVAHTETDAAELLRGTTKEIVHLRQNNEHETTVTTHEGQDYLHIPISKQFETEEITDLLTLCDQLRSDFTALHPDRREVNWRMHLNWGWRRSGHSYLELLSLRIDFAEVSVENSTDAPITN